MHGSIACVNCCTQYCREPCNTYQSKSPRCLLHRVDGPYLGLLYFGRTGRSSFRRRTPAPPPFSAMNSMPAFSRAPRTSSSVRGYGSLTPRSKSIISTTRSPGGRGGLSIPSQGAGALGFDPADRMKGPVASLPGTANFAAVTSNYLLDRLKLVQAPRPIPDRSARLCRVHFVPSMCGLLQQERLH